MLLNEYACVMNGMQDGFWDAVHVDEVISNVDVDGYDCDYYCKHWRRYWMLYNRVCNIRHLRRWCACEVVCLSLSEKLLVLVTVGASRSSSFFNASSVYIDNRIADHRCWCKTPVREPLKFSSWRLIKMHKWLAFRLVDLTMVAYVNVIIQPQPGVPANKISSLWVVIFTENCRNLSKTTENTDN